LEVGDLVSKENSRGAVETSKKANLANIQFALKSKANVKDKNASSALRNNTTLSKPRGRTFRLSDLVRKRKTLDNNGKDDGKLVKQKKVSKAKTDKKRCPIFEILDGFSK